MKSLLKIAAVAVVALGLAACSTTKAPEPTPAPAVAQTQTATPAANPSSHYVSSKSKAKKCAMIQAKLRNMDRQAPGAQAKVEKLEAALEKLDCGVK